jgi:hypothetical protein
MLVYDNLQCVYTLKMEAASVSETLVRTYQTIQYHKPEDPSPSSLRVYFSASYVYYHYSYYYYCYYYYHHHHHYYSIHPCNFKFTNVHKTLLVYYLMLRFNAVATHRKVAGSIPNGVIGILHRCNPSGRTVALESTQLLKEMSTRNVS